MRQGLVYLQFAFTSVAQSFGAQSKEIHIFVLPVLWGHQKDN